MIEEIFKGLLTKEKTSSFILGADGIRHLEGEIIWSGYLKHWVGSKVCARRLPQKDYETHRPIIIMWPDVPVSNTPFVELYFNERLAKYPVSFLGHLAVNVSGDIFNYSHMINENEVMRGEEYFFRPALGEFAPHPVTGRDNLDDPQRPYYDKFGRLFMRTIHVLRIEGLGTQRLAHYLQNQLEIIRNTPPNPKKPEKYAKFNLFTRSCSTIIRDGFHDLGYKTISGTFPRELFINISYFFFKQHRDPSITACGHTLRQLDVPEAAPSVMPPLLNPLNRCKAFQLRKR